MPERAARLRTLGIRARRWAPFPTSCPTTRRFTSLRVTCRKRRDPKSPLFTLVARVRPPFQTWGVQIPPPRQIVPNLVSPSGNAETLLWMERRAPSPSGARRGQAVRSGVFAERRCLRLERRLEQHGVAAVEWVRERPRGIDPRILVRHVSKGMTSHAASAKGRRRRTFTGARP